VGARDPASQLPSVRIPALGRRRLHRGAKGLVTAKGPDSREIVHVHVHVCGKTSLVRRRRTILSATCFATPTGLAWKAHALRRNPDAVRAHLTQPSNSRTGRSRSRTARRVSPNSRAWTPKAAPRRDGIRDHQKITCSIHPGPARDRRICAVQGIGSDAARRSGVRFVARLRSRERPSRGGGSCASRRA